MTIAFFPALIAILVAKERESGRALTQQEKGMLYFGGQGIQLQWQMKR
ncbi:hypothetical protein [Enterobacter asburiae]|nr:hypothetical protein [Enterobacter asburiae]WKE11761.1 hypothetical protein QOM24_11605 [Enterobacter asburiae]